MRRILCCAVVAAAGAAASGSVIDFDSVPAFTQVTNQFGPAVFSSEPGMIVQVMTYGLDGSSVPNVVIPAYPNQGPNCLADLYVDFTVPVNGLSFRVCAANEFGVIARVNVYSGATLLGTDDIIGLGPSPGNFGYGSVIVNLGAYANITRIEVVPPIGLFDVDASYGGGGLIYDDFNFEAVPGAGAAGALSLGAAIALRRRRR